ncbi:MAG: hypothetical protein FWG54_05195 [Bacteroidetes bacterium]|nr:hypothetical protein [Bacteroidota bacterium]
MIEPALLRPVADVLKLFGNNGTLIVKFRPQEVESFQETEPVFAFMDGMPVPFYIASIDTKGNDRARILFDSIYGEREALELVGKTLYSPRSEPEHGTKEHPNATDPNLLIGFTAFHIQQEPLGTVDAFMNWHLNPCLSIRPANKTENFLVPFQQAFIQDIDFKAKRINLILPEGLTLLNA